MRIVRIHPNIVEVSNGDTYSFLSPNHLCISILKGKEPFAPDSWSFDIGGTIPDTIIECETLRDAIRTASTFIRANRRTNPTNHIMLNDDEAERVWRKYDRNQL